MRVLYLPGYRYPTSLDEPLTSGDLRYSFNLSRALARAGSRVTVLTRAHPGDPESQNLDGVRIQRYRPELERFFSTSFDMSMRRLKLFRSLTRDMDVLVLHSPLTLELGLRLHCPSVYVCSGLEDARNYGRSPGEIVQSLGLRLLRDPSKRLSWRRAALVDTTAEGEVKTLERLGVPTEKIITIGPSVELQRYRPQPEDGVRALRAVLAPHLGPRPGIVLSVSRFTPAKGLLETLRAFAKLQRQRADVVLVVAGVHHSHRPGYFADVLATATELGLGKAFVLQRDVPESRLPLYYSAADVTSVFSVGYDPLPTVMIESMSCGTPVVATDFSTRRQVIAHGETGLMIPEKDEDAWVTAVRSLLDDPALATRMGKMGLRAVRRRFDADQVAARYLELFRAL